MKLATAMILGSTQVKATRNTLLVRRISSSGQHVLRGCAMGMACAAAGHIKEAIRERDTVSPIYRYWPWTQNFVQSPCMCEVQTTVAKVIGHVFDNHVLNSYDSWTFDRLVEWIASIEGEESEQPAHEIRITEAEVTL